MQTKLIVADGETEYAYAENYEWNSRYSGRKAHRVVVEEKGVARKVWTTWGSSSQKDGVRVRFLADSGKAKKGETKVVRSAEIREVWETYDTAAKAAAKARKERVTAAREKYDREFERVRANLPENVQLPYWVGPPSEGRSGLMESVRGTVTLHELGDLLDAAYAQGVNDEAARSGSRA